MSKPRFIHNVGRIAMHNEESFWIFPIGYTNDSEHNMCSPWFSHLGEKWQFVMERSSIRNSTMFHLYLWRKFRGDLPKDRYTVQLKLNEEHIDYTIYTQPGTGYRKEDFNSDYGYQALNFFSIVNLRTKENHARLIKIYFAIKQKDNFSDTPLYDKTNKVETSSEDEMTSDEEDNKKKKVIFKDKGVDRLLQNLKRLLQDEQSSDVLLKVEDREFKAHRAILKVRSPVFESMFQPNTKESISGVVDIHDISASAFEIFLLYMYTGCTDTISSDNIADLYYAADKYEVNDLKSECVEFMEKNLSVDNFCEVMTLSLQHSELSLQKTATQFFCGNVKKIIKTVQWQKFLKDYATQANELYMKAINA